jgi:glycosidase
VREPAFLLTLNKIFMKKNLLLSLYLWLCMSFVFVQPVNAQVDFREETIYFLMTTRFFDGDPSNNRPNEWCSYNPDPEINPEITDPDDVTWRGDFKGLIEKLDYIKDLGFTAIWITPVVHNRGPLDYHGYHAWDFTRVDPRLESPGATFQDLINEVHARGMKIVLDVVTNHSGRFGIKDRAELKYNTDPNSSWYAPDNPDWEYDGLTPNPFDNKIWSRANLAKMPPPYNENLSLFNWPSKETFVDTSDPNWFHHSGNGFAQGWDDTVNLYYRALADDCPDLATGSPYVRDYMVEAYTTFINMGVDGFRWDTMKHMPKRDVLYFYDKWKEVNPDLFVFGEVAQLRHELHNVEEINPHWYTWRGAVGQSENSGIAVLDFFAEATFHNVFEYGQNFSQVRAAARYDHLYSDPSTLLTWLDNHDFGPNNDWNKRYGGTPENLAACMNFMFTWRGIPVVYYGTEVQFMKGAFADIKEPSDIRKSINNTGRAYYGDEFDNAPNHPIYQHIKKLNAIRRAVPALQKGEWSWNGTHDGNGVGYIRKHGNSEVAVGLAKDGGVTFNFTGLTNGIYRDAVTGEERNVTNGTLTCYVEPASAAIYVLNGPGMIGGNGVGFFQPGQGTASPLVTASPSGGFFANPVTVSLNSSGGEGNLAIYYTFSGGDPVQTGTLYTNAIQISETAILRAVAVDGQGNRSQVIEHHYAIGEGDFFKVYFQRPQGWGNDIRIHHWGAQPQGALSATNWPGVQMTNNGDGWYEFTFQGIASTNLLFHDNNGNQTADLFRDRAGRYVNGQWEEIEGGGGGMPQVVVVNPQGPHSASSPFDITMIADGAQIYYTLDGSTPDQNSPNAANMVTITVNESLTLKVFSIDQNGRSSEVYTHEYTVTTQDGFTVYFRKPSAWSNNIRVHHWGAQPSGSLSDSSWPGTPMVSIGNGWFRYSFSGITSTNLLFHDGNGNQTADLARDRDGWYENGHWSNNGPTGGGAPQGLTVHVKTNWSTPTLYYWNVEPAGAAPATTWPGVGMTATGNGWYSYTIPGASCANVIFSNNGSPQTADLHRCQEGWYMNGTWHAQNPESSQAEEASVALNSKEKHEQVELMQNYPNPVNGRTTIGLRLSEDAHISLKLYNSFGTEVQDLLNGRLTKGSHRVVFEVSNLPNGIYIYRLETQGNSFYKRLIISK